MLALNLCWQCMAPADAVKAAQQSAKAGGVFFVFLKRLEVEQISKKTLYTMLLLMEEILHHLRCIKPCK